MRGKQRLKKRNILYIIFVSLLYFIFRMIHISGILSENISFLSFYISFILIVLPSVYGAVSYYLIGSLPRAMLMNFLGLTISVIVITLCTQCPPLSGYLDYDYEFCWNTQCPPLSEGMWFIVLIPVMLISYFAARLIHTSKSRKYKLLVSILFCVVLAGIAGIVYSVIYALLSW